MRGQGGREQNPVVPSHTGTGDGIKLHPPTAPEPKIVILDTILFTTISSVTPDAVPTLGLVAQCTPARVRAAAPEASTNLPGLPIPLLAGMGGQVVEMLKPLGSRIGLG